MRFRQDTVGELARARAAVGAWRDQNPLGTFEQVVAMLGRDFHKDYSPVLRGVLFAYDRHRARQITEIIADTVTEAAR